MKKARKIFLAPILLLIFIFLPLLSIGCSSSSYNDQYQNEESISYTVYKTRTGSKYHSDGCQYLRQSSIAISVDDAQDEGLSPCSVCNP